jgi:chromosome segregation ATPase
MSTKKTTVNSFVNQFLALVKGDSAEAQAEKAWRQAKSALTSEIARLDADTVDLETEIETCQELLTKARVNNGEAILDRADYLTNLLQAKNDLIEAENELAEHEAKLEFYKSELESLQSEK